MSAIITPDQMPLSWFKMVSPTAEEMPDFLKKAGTGWRTPKRKWEQLWRLRAGEFRGPKRQRGSVSAFAGHAFPAAGGGTSPDLSDITDHHSVSAPTIARISIAYDSDGAIRADLSATTIGSITYFTLTTESDDANDHTGEWWPDQPETNEGLNWDIRYTNLVEGGSASARWYFYDTGGAANRIEDTWYLLDTVSNDHADASAHGALGINRSNGTGKSPSTGSADNVMDVEIRATGSGSAVASHQVDITVTGT